MWLSMEYSEFYNKVKLQVKNWNKYTGVENTAPFQLRVTNKSDISHRHYGFTEFWTASVHIIKRHIIFIYARFWFYLLHISSKASKHRSTIVKKSKSHWPKKAFKNVRDSCFLSILSESLQHLQAWVKDPHSFLLCIAHTLT